jgi:hypothetical protein
MEELYGNRYFEQNLLIKEKEFEHNWKFVA